jgi:hypothetical protein
LYVIHNLGAASDNDCPKTSKKKIMDNVKEYKVVSNRDTTIVNAALSEDGTFYAWDDNKVVYSDRNIKDFQMNTCYGQQGKSFSSIVLFTLDQRSYITKVKVAEGLFGTYDRSSMTDRTFDNIAEFKDRLNVCQ